MKCQLDTPPSRQAPRGTIEIKVYHDLSPRAASAFVKLVEAGFYDGCYFFRVLQGFVAQFGLNPRYGAQKAGQQQPPQPPPKVGADLVTAASLRHVRGTVAFAGGSSTQVYINLGDNSRMDGEMRRPFATIDAESMKLIDQLHMGYKDGEGQVGAVNAGPDAVAQRFPEMSWVQECRLVTTGAAASAELAQQ